jgi:UDP-N-acetylglucosamine 2-epimerase (non-hydrolysing)
MRNARRPPFSIVAIVGTRPELIKMAPVVRCLNEEPAVFTVRLWAVEQQDVILRRALAEWSVEPARVIRLSTARKDPVRSLARMLPKLHVLLSAERPDIVLVQGDTLTTLAASLAATYARMPLGHIEAGLRSFSDSEPFPEELHRMLVAQMSAVHYAPTTRAAANLLKAGCHEDRVVVVGNTVIDAMRLTLGPDVIGLPTDGADGGRCPLKRSQNARNLGFAAERRLIVVTAHRRESFSGGIDRLCSAIRELAATRHDIEFAYVLHPNPKAHEPVRARLSGVRRVKLLPPLSYREFLALLSSAHVVVTDSGGVQEEAPYLGKPVLVVREATERPEPVEQGAAEVVGLDTDSIVSAVCRLLDDPVLYRKRAVRVQPFGDGRASHRIRDDLRRRFGSDSR